MEVDCEIAIFFKAKTNAKHERKQRKQIALHLYSEYHTMAE